VTRVEESVEIGKQLPGKWYMLVRNLSATSRPGKSGAFGNVILGKFYMLAGNFLQQHYQFLKFLRS